MAKKKKKHKKHNKNKINHPIFSPGQNRLLIIFLLALLYRFLCFSVIGNHPLFLNPIVDAGYFDHWAQRIVAGDLFGHGPDDVFKPPLYAYFLAVFYMFGRSILMIQWVQYILGSLSCVMIGILCARLLGRNVGLVAGILSALYAPFVFFESQLLTPGLSIFLNLAALLVLVQHKMILSYKRMFISGLLLGLSAGVRQDVLLPAFLVVFFLLWRYRTEKYIISVKKAACLVAGLMTIILPITIRNIMITKQFIPVSSNAGINFYTGNSAQADGISAVPVGLKWERLVSRVPQQILEQPAKANRFWINRTVEDIAANPGKTLLRLIKKGLAFFNSCEFRNNICFHFMQDRAWPLRLPFVQYSIILCLAICGMIAMHQDRKLLHDSAIMLPLLWSLGFWLAGVIFFVTSRFRIPVVPLLMIPASWEFVRIASLIRIRQWQPLILDLIVAIVASILILPLWFCNPSKTWVRDYVNYGNAMTLAGNMKGAERAYLQALTLRNDPDAHFLLAKLLAAKGKTVQALQHLEAATTIMPDSPDLLLTSAQVHLAAMNPQRARELLNHLLNLSKGSNLWPKRPEWATAHIILADIEPSNADEHWKQAWIIHPTTAAEVCFMQRKDMQRAVETFRSESENKPWDWYSQANYGMVLLENGNAAAAIAPLSRAVRLAPDKPGLRFHLARAFSGSGNKIKAINILEKLIKDLPDCALLRNVKALNAQLKDSGR